MPHRLALSIDPDLDDSDRLDIISGLVRHGGEAAAVSKWLTFETIEDTVDHGWKYQAAPIVSFHVPEDDYAHGLRLIATNAFLTNRLRIAACCDLVEYNPGQAYHLIRKVTKTQWLALELVDSRNERAPTQIERFVLDDSVAFAERIQIIEWLENEDTRQARDLYESLARATLLTDEQRNTASLAAEHLRDNR